MAVVSFTIDPNIFSEQDISNSAPGIREFKERYEDTGEFECEPIHSLVAGGDQRRGN